MSYSVRCPPVDGHVLLGLEQLEGPECTGSGGRAESSVRGLRAEGVLGDVRVLAGRKGVCIHIVTGVRGESRCVIGTMPNEYLWQNIAGGSSRLCLNASLKWRMAL